MARPTRWAFELAHDEAAGGEGLIGGDAGKLLVAVEAARGTRVEQGGGVEALDFRRDLHREVGGVEEGDRADAGAPVEQRPPSRFDVKTQRADDPQPGHDDWLHVFPPHMADVRYGCGPSARTSSSGRVARCRTPSATLPKKKCARPVRPWLAIAIRSTFSLSAKTVDRLDDGPVRVARLAAHSRRQQRRLPLGQVAPGLAFADGHLVQKGRRLQVLRVADQRRRLDDLEQDERRAKAAGQPLDVRHDGLGPFRSVQWNQDSLVHGCVTSRTAARCAGGGGRAPRRDDPIIAWSGSRGECGYVKGDIPAALRSGSVSKQWAMYARAA